MNRLKQLTHGLQHPTTKRTQFLLGLGVYSVSQKNHHPVTCGFLKFFHEWLRILNQFLHNYYTFLPATDYRTNFYSVIANFTEVMPY